jgi:hypothetical protein
MSAEKDSDNFRNWSLYPARTEVQARGDDHRLVAIGPAVSGRVDVVAAADHWGTVEESQRLRSALAVMTTDRDSWKALARFHESKALARRAAGGQ